MDRHRNRKRNNNWKNNQQNQRNNLQNQKINSVERRQPQFNPNNYEDEAANKERLRAIEEIKSRQIICPKCNQPITDITSCLADKSTNSPIHFECALNDVSKNEKLGENEKIAYIGQGRFGILYYENPRDQRHFTIKKIIEWEDRDTKSEWRGELSELYSKVN